MYRLGRELETIWKHQTHSKLGNKHDVFWLSGMIPHDTTKRDYRGTWIGITEKLIGQCFFSKPWLLIGRCSSSFPLPLGHFFDCLTFIWHSVDVPLVGCVAQTRRDSWRQTAWWKSRNLSTSCPFDAVPRPFHVPVYMSRSQPARVQKFWKQQWRVCYNTQQQQTSVTK